MDLMRLSNIANYLTLEKDLEAAVQYIALNSCMSGEPSRFYLARLNSDLTLYHLASFGFSEEFIAKNREFSLLTNPLLNQAIQSESVLIRNRDDQYRRELRTYLKLRKIVNGSPQSLCHFFPIMQLLSQLRLKFLMRIRIKTTLLCLRLL